MASTYELIASQTLGSDTASVTFSSIPGTYDDLVLTALVRTDRASVVDGIYLHFNSDGSNNCTSRYLRGNGASASSGTTSAAQKLEISGSATANSATANTFGSIEAYIPNYAGAANKSVSMTGAHETNATTAYLTVVAGLWSQTSAITSIALSPVNGTNLKTGSSFYLYGVTHV